MQNRTVLTDLSKSPCYAEAKQVYDSNEHLFAEREKTSLVSLQGAEEVLLRRIDLLEKSLPFFSDSTENTSRVKQELADTMYDLATTFFKQLQLIQERENKTDTLVKRLNFIEKSLSIYRSLYKDRDYHPNNKTEDLESLRTVAQEISESNEELGDLYFDADRFELARKAYVSCIFSFKATKRAEEDSEWQLDVYMSLFQVMEKLKIEMRLESSDQQRLKKLIKCRSLGTPSEEVEELMTYPYFQKLLRPEVKSIPPMAESKGIRPSAPPLRPDRTGSLAQEPVLSDQRSLFFPKKVKWHPPLILPYQDQSSKKQFSAAKKRKPSPTNTPLEIRSTKKIQTNPIPKKELSPLKETMPKKKEQVVPPAEKEKKPWEDAPLNFLFPHKKMQQPLLEEKPYCRTPVTVKKNNGIYFVSLHAKRGTPVDKMIVYDLDGTLIPQRASSEKSLPVFICSDEVKAVAQHAKENNIMIAILTARPFENYSIFGKKPSSSYQIAKKLFGEDGVSLIIYTNDIFDGKGFACDALWKEYFPGISDLEKENRMCLVDDLRKNLVSGANHGVRIIQIGRTPCYQQAQHQKVLEFAQEPLETGLIHAKKPIKTGSPGAS